jgi:hypothetical protein
MNFIASWYVRICEIRDALAGGQVAGLTLVPDFLSVSYLRTRESHKGFDKRQEMREYALILSLVALVLFAHFATR